MGNEYPQILTPPGPFDKGILFGDVEQPKTGIYEESATQQYALGTQLIYNDGRKFRYCQNGAAAMVKASMYQCAAVTSNIQTQAQATSYANAALGLYEFVCDIATGSSLAENYLAEGIMVVNKVTGLGDIYKVLANKVDGSDDTLMRVLLDSAIRTALAATSELTFVTNRWKSVVITPATTITGCPAGVALIATTAAYYCWLQTGGTAAIILDTTDNPAIGEPVGYPGTCDVAGTCGVPANDATDMIWGTLRYDPAGAETALVELLID